MYTAALGYAMAIVYLIKALNSMDMAHFACMAAWLALGIIYTIRNLGKNKKSDNRLKEREN